MFNRLDEICVRTAKRTSISASLKSQESPLKPALHTHTAEQVGEPFRQSEIWLPSASRTNTHCPFPEQSFEHILWGKKQAPVEGTQLYHRGQSNDVLHIDEGVIGDAEMRLGSMHCELLSPDSPRKEPEMQGPQVNAVWEQLRRLKDKQLIERGMVQFTELSIALAIVVACFIWLTLTAELSCDEMIE